MPGFLDRMFRPRQPGFGQQDMDEQQMPAGMFGAPDPQMAQPQGMFGGLSRFNERNPGLLLGAGQLIAGNDVMPAVEIGLKAKATRKERAEKERKQSMTRNWLIKNRGLSEEDADAAMADPAIMSAYMKSKEDGDAVRYGLNPIWGQDADGKDALGVLGDDGSFKPIDTGGFTASRGVEKVDLGTEWGFVNKSTGELIRREPKQNYQEAFDTAKGGAEGKGAGEAAEAQRSIGSKMSGIEQVVAKLDDLAGKATYTMTGQGIDWANKQLGLEPREAAIARAEYIAIVDNQVLPLMRDTFGAAFTQKEGDTLRATLGDPDKSPAEKQAVLKAFIEQKRRDLEALAARTGQGNQPPPTGGTGGDYKQKYGLE